MKKQFLLLIVALALVPALVLLACGKSPTSPSPNPSGAPPPPVVVCTPQFPPTLVTGWTLQTGRAAGETVLTQKSSIKVTFAWTPSTAPTGVFVFQDIHSMCGLGKPCDNALASDYTSASPKVIQTGQLNPGSYWVVLENLDAQGITIGPQTVVEICK
jgi:hypothetical protein